MKDYLEVVYDEDLRPKTAYPEKLCRHLATRFLMSPGDRLLEAGCGRGEFLQGFASLGLNTTGLDACASTNKSGSEVHIVDLEQEPIPFPDNTFDVVFSKSFIEHLFHPERFLREAGRVLKPDGLLLTMVPEWESNMKIYFDDFTHRTPFNRPALLDIYAMCGFRQAVVERFHQLPVTWEHPWMNHICAIIAPFVPPRTIQPFFRWSREIMLLGYARKAPAKHG